MHDHLAFGHDLAEVWRSHQVMMPP